jgi:hypothetical protein
MAKTYEPIATNTLATTASTITFSSIPQTYTDLRVVIISTTNPAGRTHRIQLNSVSTGVYSQGYIYGTRTTGTSATAKNTSQTFIDFTQNTGTDSTIPVMSIIDIFNYTSTSVYKTALGFTCGDKNSSGSVERTVGVWPNTNAVTTVSFTLGSDVFQVGTQATLYGIKAA